MDGIILPSINVLIYEYDICKDTDNKINWTNIFRFYRQLIIKYKDYTPQLCNWFKQLPLNKLQLIGLRVDNFQTHEVITYSNLNTWIIYHRFQFSNITEVYLRRTLEDDEI